MRTTKILIFISIIFSQFGNAQNFYYYKNTKKQIVINPNKFIIFHMYQKK